jgi:tryptophan synthase alpha chain
MVLKYKKGHQDKMNRVEHKLKQLSAQRRKILSPYITAGDPHPDHTVPLMHELVRAGADIIELGLPFSDPMAEGPVIQQAMERALAHGVHCREVMQLVKTFRHNDQETPVILMGYLNPIEQYGYEAFARDAVAAGIDGTILVDLPPEESALIAKVWQQYGLYSIFLCSPTTSAERMKLISQKAEGYLYYVSLKGVTGASLQDIEALKKNYQRRKQQIQVPLVVGFGIKTPQIAAEVAAFADGVVVGAALITAISDAYKAQKNVLHCASSLINSIRLALDAAS